MKAMDHTTRRIIAQLVRFARTTDDYWHNPEITDVVAAAEELIDDEYDALPATVFVRFLKDTSHPDYEQVSAGDVLRVTREYARDYEALGFAQQIDPD